MNNTLKDLILLSQYAAQPYWVQGPGGNTSVKDETGSMYVKASGGFLKELDAASGWVEVDAPCILKVLKEDGLSAREPAGAQRVDDAVKGSVVHAPAEGLRPSMETGFHALYHKYVLHTHPVFANIYLCSDHAEEIQECLPDPDECFSALLTDYYTPGAELSWMLYERFRFRPEMPQITLLPNHGMIISADSLEEVMRLNNELHRQLCRKLNLEHTAYPGYSLPEKANGFILVCPYLQNYFERSGLAPQLFSEYLVPDHIVYLYPEYFSTEQRHAKIYFDPVGKTIHLNTVRKEAIALAELMINNAFLHEQITSRGFEPLTINYDADKLRNMGAERFRKKSME